MNTNQAFEILKKSGGVRAARIIIGDKKNISWIAVHQAAWALRRGVPVAKIVGCKWFYGLPFYTNKHTLDPRPDSETLVAAVLENTNVGTILDLGTGTGCLIASIVKNMDGCTGLALEKSRPAIRVAKRNIKQLGLDKKINVIRGDFTKKSDLGKFDIIISNPPYIASGDERVNMGAMHDPKRALYAKENGLAAYIAIADNAKSWIRPGGKIYLEIGEGQEDAVRDIFTRAGWAYEKSWEDLCKIERVLCFSKN